MKELFSIGPIHIYFLGLMTAIGILAGLFFVLKQAKKRDINEDLIFNFAIWCVLAGIIGARLFYILFYDPVYYFKNPSQIFMITEGGLSIHGGIFAAVITGVIFSIKNKISFFKLADVAVMGIPLGQGIGRVGCDVFGKAMTTVMPWGIKINGQVLHPAQVYEFILDYVLFIFLWRKSEKQKYEGELFVNYIIGFALIRGIVEFFRINPIIWGPFSISHVLSLVFIIAALVIYKFIHNRPYTAAAGELSKVSFARQLVCLVCLIIVSMAIFYHVQG